VASLNHLHLHVLDLARSQAFYERWFGFRHHVDHGTIRFLRDEAGLDLALAPAGAVETLPRWFHFGFRLADGPAVRDLRSRMTEAGVPLVEGGSYDGEDFVTFRIEDPDGYRIEVYWEEEP
jgi:catechol 2,3-dioxygenase-like lactoylglutathione lyase family enzyme